MTGHSLAYGGWGEMRQELTKRLIVSETWGTESVYVKRQELLDLMATIQLLLHPAPATRYSFQ